MSSFIEPLKSWFGYSRRERRSTFILLILIVAVAGIRFVLPAGQEIQIEEIPVPANMSYSDTLPIKANKPFNQEQKITVKGNNPTPLIDINTCDSTMLEALPGIGPVLSARIVKYRHLLGGYATVDQLREVYGLSIETFNLISARLFADPAAVKKIIINSCDFRELIRFPYLERSEVNAILKYRELQGQINSMDDIIDNKLIQEVKIEKIRPYLEF